LGTFSLSQPAVLSNTIFSMRGKRDVGSPLKPYDALGALSFSQPAISPTSIFSLVGRAHLGYPLPFLSWVLGLSANLPFCQTTFFTAGRIAKLGHF